MTDTKIDDNITVCALHLNRFTTDERHNTGINKTEIKVTTDDKIFPTVKKKFTML